MQNSFAWHCTGNLAANFGSVGKTSPFKQGDVIGCGVAFDTFNKRCIFITLNGKFLQFLEAKVSPAMDCFPTISFAGKDITLLYNFGTSPFVWDLADWPKAERQNFILTLPKETLEHIISVSRLKIYKYDCIANVMTVCRSFDAVCQSVSGTRQQAVQYAQHRQLYMATIGCE